MGAAEQLPFEFEGRDYVAHLRPLTVQQMLSFTKLESLLERVDITSQKAAECDDPDKFEKWQSITERAREEAAEITTTTADEVVEKVLTKAGELVDPISLHMKLYISRISAEAKGTAGGDEKKSEGSSSTS